MVLSLSLYFPSLNVQLIHPFHQRLLLHNCNRLVV
jgi:hypothetical protein